MLPRGLTGGCLPALGFVVRHFEIGSISFSCVRVNGLPKQREDLGIGTQTVKEGHLYYSIISSVSNNQVYNMRLGGSDTLINFILCVERGHNDGG